MATQNELPEETKKQIAQLQNMQNQIQTLRIQLDANQREYSEIKATLKEIENHDDDDELYKSIGPVFFKTTTKKAREEFKDRQELLEIKIDALKKQEERSKTQLTELNDTISLQIGRINR